MRAACELAGGSESLVEVRFKLEMKKVKAIIKIKIIPNKSYASLQRHYKI